MECVEGILERYDNNVYAYMTKNMSLAVHIIRYLRNQFSVDPPGGSTLGEAVFVCSSPLTSFVYNSGSG